MISWIVSVLLALCIFALTVALVFCLWFIVNVVFDELKRFSLVRAVSRVFGLVLIPTAILGIVVSATYGIASVLHAGWEEHHAQKVAQPAASTQIEVSTPPEVPSWVKSEPLPTTISDRIATETIDIRPLVVDKREPVIEHIIDGKEDRWYVLDDNNRWHILGANEAHGSATTTYVRGSDGQYYLTDPPPVYEGINTEGWKP